MRGSTNHNEPIDEEEDDRRRNTDNDYDQDEQQDDDEQLQGEDQRATECDGEEYGAEPPSPSQLSRTQSDPTPMPTEAERDKVSESQENNVPKLMILVP